MFYLVDNHSYNSFSYQLNASFDFILFRFLNKRVPFSLIKALKGSIVVCNRHTNFVIIKPEIKIIHKIPGVSIFSSNFFFFFFFFDTKRRVLKNQINNNRTQTWSHLSILYMRCVSIKWYELRNDIEKGLEREKETKEREKTEVTMRIINYIIFGHTYTYTKRRRRDR